VVVVEQMGRELMPGPFVPTVIGSALLVAAGDEGLKQQLLPGLATGATRAGLALTGSVQLRDGCAFGSA